LPVMHIVFANRYYAPDVSATSQLVADLAQHLAARGHRVEVITSRQRYDDPGVALPTREAVNGVAVRRVWTSRFGRGRLWGRALDYLTFYLGFFLTVLRVLEKGSVLVCCTDPPLLSVPAGAACRLRRARLVNWLQDLYPEVAVGLGVLPPGSAPVRALGRLRDWSLRGAVRNVALGEVMAERVGALGVDPERIRVIHNWSVVQGVDATGRAGDVGRGGGASPDEAVAGDGGAGRKGVGEHSLRMEWGLEESFVVAYSGNLGKAHEIDTLLGAAQGLRDERAVKFLVIGGGHYTDQLRARAESLRLDNILFKPYQPRERLAESLAVADVHLVILRPEMEGLIVPSKFYGAAASGRPVIFIGSPGGEIARILEASGAGLTVASGDSAGLARSILELRDNPGSRSRMAKNASRLTEGDYSRNTALARWTALLCGE